MFPRLSTSRYSPVMLSRMYRSTHALCIPQADKCVDSVQDSGLINGIGRFNGGPEGNHIRCLRHKPSSRSLPVPFAVINVEQGKRYRLRIFSLSCRPFFTFSIDQHNLTFIEADVTEHEPVEVQNVDLHAGQRVSVVLNANQPVNNYWIRAPSNGVPGLNNPNCT